MTANYPIALAAFVTKVDDRDTCYASDMNDVQQEIYSTQQTLGVSPIGSNVHVYPTGLAPPTDISDRIAIVERAFHVPVFSISGTITGLTTTSKLVTWGSYIYNSHDSNKLDNNYLNLPTPWFLGDGHTAPWLVVVDAAITTTTAVPALTSRPEFILSVSKRIAGTPVVTQSLTSTSALQSSSSFVDGTWTVGQHIPLVSTEFLTPKDSLTVEMKATATWAPTVNVNITVVQIRA